MSEVKKLRTIGFKPSLWFAFGLGAGFVPRAPGTAGTLLGIPLVLLIDKVPVLWQVSIWIVLFVVGCVICQQAANWLGEQDPSAIVWDEIAGYCIAMAFVPVTPITIVAAFVLFRWLDIIKPWPISWIEKRTSGGFGIMLDDMLAGILTCGVIHVLITFRILII